MDSSVASFAENRGVEALKCWNCAPIGDKKCEKTSEGNVTECGSDKPYCAVSEMWM